MAAASAGYERAWLEAKRTPFTSTQIEVKLWP
jgi:hypothetical protein